MWGNKRMRVCGLRGSGARLNGQIGEVSAFDLHCVEEFARFSNTKLKWVDVNRPTRSKWVEVGLRGGCPRFKKCHLELAEDTKVGHGVLSL